MICKQCHMAHLLQHPEQPLKWLKCPICGFSVVVNNNETKVLVSNDQSANSYLSND